MLDWLLKLLIDCWWLSDDARGGRNWTGAFALMAVILGAVGLVWLFIWLVGMMATYGRA